MTKKALFALLLVAVMALSGCSLVLRDSAVDAQQAIIDVNGEQITKQDFVNAYNYNLYSEQYYAQMMAQFGLSDGSVDQNAVLQTTVDSYVNSLVLSQKAKELGFDQFTEEEKFDLDAEAQSQYDAQLETIQSSAFADSELSGEALTEAVETYAQSQGYTLEYFRNLVENTKISERLQASVTDLVSITDADLQAALDEKIAAEKASYESSLAAYGAAANRGTATYYTPAGYRAIRTIEVAKPAADAEGNVDATQAQADAAALAERLAAGEAIDALDVDVTDRVVCESSTDVDSALVAAAMALTEKGSYTEVTETASSFAIAQYVDDVAEHTATLEEARDSIYDETLQNAQSAAYTAAVSEWVSAANVKINLDRLN